MRFLFTCILIIFSTSVKAEIISKSLGDTGVVFINGKIETGDMQTFVSLPIEWDRTIVLLNSDGGSAADAIVMSAFLVTKGVVTYVLPNHECLTECTLIWLSGLRKMSSNSSSIGFENSRYELSNEEKQLIGPMILGEGFDPNVSGLGFVAVGSLLKKGFGLDFEFIQEFVSPSDINPRYLGQADFDKYNLNVLLENDDSGAFRDALKGVGILSD